MSDARLARQIRFLLEADALKHVERRSWLVGGARRENAAEHSWHVALLALLLAEHADEPVDAARVVAMMLVHDLVEIDAGDTFRYDEAGNRDRRSASAGPPIASMRSCPRTRAARCVPSGRSTRPARAPRPASPPRWIA